MCDATCTRQQSTGVHNKRLLFITSCTLFQSQAEFYQKMCTDSTRGRGMTAWHRMHYSGFTGQCLQIGHASSYAQHGSGDQAWLASFSTVTSVLVAGSQAVPSDRCVRVLLLTAPAQGLTGFVITTVTGAMQCSSRILAHHSLLEKHQQASPSGNKLHCALCKSLARCLP